MIRGVLRGFAIAALVFVGCGAAAQEPESFGENLARQHPVDCLQRLTPVLVEDILQRDLVAWIEGIGEGRKLPPGWKWGESHFDTAFQLAYSRVLAEEAKHGPLASIDMADRFARAFDRANAAERAQLTKFFATPLGQPTWSHHIDDGFCHGLIGAMKERLPRNGHYELANSLQQEIDARGAAYEKEMRALTPVERSDIRANTELILDLFMKDDAAEKIPSNRLGIPATVIFDRLGRDVGGCLPKVLKQADAFAAANKS